MAQPVDDDRTLMPEPAGRADAATAIASQPGAIDEHNALPVGARVAEFEIRSIIGIGGFGIVYLAHDHSLGRDVALKEYLPTSLAQRSGMNVSLKAARHADTFAAGLSSFINEARVLAQFDNPSLVKVYRFWNENGTAYMVMPFYEGPTLKQALEQASAPPTEAWLKELLAPLLSALELLHHDNYFHRDIAPDNILLVKGRRPILLDFGAARRVIAGSGRALTVILKPGYAPVEQYSDTAEMTQGAWTDIYALAAVMHFAITGQPPVASVSRLIKDLSTPLAQSAAGRYSDGFLRAIDKALSVRPADRPQTIAEFRELLGLPEVATEDAPRRSEPRIRQKSRRNLMVAGGAVAGLVAIAAITLVFMGKREAVPAGGSVATRSVPAPPASPVLPSPGPAAAPAAQGGRAPAPTPAAPGVTTAPPAVEAARALRPDDALAQLYEQRDPDHGVTVTLEQTTVRIGKDKLRFRVKSDKPGYLYIVMLGTDRQHINLLFPNSIDRRNEVKGGETINLPRTGWTMTAGGPPGINDFVAVVSGRPRDFGQVGLTPVGPFAEFPLDKVLALSAAKPGAGPALAGAPKCDTGSACPAGYGAARFSIEEVN